MDIELHEYIHDIMQWLMLALLPPNGPYSPVWQNLYFKLDVDPRRDVDASPMSY